MDTPADSDKTTEAEQIIEQYMLASAGTGMVPLPLLDTAALTGVQLRMLQRLSALYRVEFTVPVAKTLLSTLATTTFRLTIGRSLFSFSKFIPGFGQSVGTMGTAFLGMASTYATGKVFSKHFEQGGTLQNFNVKTMTLYYQQQLEKGKAIASQHLKNLSNALPN